MSHLQVVQDAYKFFANVRLITIFSASLYWDRFDSTAAIIIDDYMPCQFYFRRPKEHDWSKNEANNYIVKSAVFSTMYRHIMRRDDKEYQTISFNFSKLFFVGLSLTPSGLFNLVSLKLEINSDPLSHHSDLISKTKTIYSLRWHNIIIHLWETVK